MKEGRKEGSKNDRKKQAKRKGQLNKRTRENYVRIFPIFRRGQRKK